LRHISITHRLTTDSMLSSKFYLSGAIVDEKNSFIIRSYVRML
jgi:hypothetical protein